MVQIEKALTFKGHSDAVYALEKGKEPGKFYSSGGDGNVVEWNVNHTENGRLIAKISASVYSLCLIPNKNVLVVGQNYEGIHLIDIESRKQLGSLQLTNSAIFDIKCIKNLLLIATGEGKLFVVDLLTLKIVQTVIVSEKNLRNIHVLSEKHFLIASSDGYIREYSIDKYQLINTLYAHDKSVFALAKKDSDNFIVSGGRDAKLKIWQSEGKLLLDETINAHMYAINDIVFRGDGNYFATASMDKTIKIWDYSKRKLIKVIDKARHNGHLTSVNKLLWLDHKDFLVSCSDDRSIGVWHIDIKK